MLGQGGVMQFMGGGGVSANVDFKSKNETKTQDKKGSSWKQISQKQQTCLSLLFCGISKSFW